MSATSTIDADRLAPPSGLRRNRQQTILWAAAFAVITEILGLTGGLPVVFFGRIGLSASLLPGLLIVALLGRRVAGHSRSLQHAVPFWLAIGAGSAFGSYLLARDSHRIDAFAIFLASSNEEIIYRFAVPTVIAAVLVSIGVRVGLARISGFAFAAAWFVLLPGHRAQMTDLAQVPPFLAFATLTAFISYRSGSIAATAGVHTVINMLTILSVGGILSPATRSIGVACLLILLVAGYALPARNYRVAATDELVIDLRTPDETVIDLRDGALRASPEDASIRSKESEPSSLG